jgi:hypothetical protein
MICLSGPGKDSLIVEWPLYPSIPDFAAQVGEVFYAPILLKKSVNFAAAVSLRGIKLSAWRLLSRYRWSLMVFKSGSAPFVLHNRLRYGLQPGG